MNKSIIITFFVYSKKKKRIYCFLGEMKRHLFTLAVRIIYINVEGEGTWEGGAFDIVGNEPEKSSSNLKWDC